MFQLNADPVQVHLLEQSAIPEWAAPPGAKVHLDGGSMAQTLPSARRLGEVAVMEHLRPL